MTYPADKGVNPYACFDRPRLTGEPLPGVMNLTSRDNAFKSKSNEEERNAHIYGRQRGPYMENPVLSNTKPVGLPFSSDYTPNMNLFPPTSNWGSVMPKESPVYPPNCRIPQNNIESRELPKSSNVSWGETRVEGPQIPEPIDDWLLYASEMKENLEKVRNSYMREKQLFNNSLEKLRQLFTDSEAKTRALYELYRKISDTNLEYQKVILSASKQPTKTIQTFEHRRSSCPSILEETAGWHQNSKVRKTSLVTVPSKPLDSQQKDYPDTKAEVFTNKPGVAPTQTNNRGMAPAQTNNRGMTQTQTNNSGVTPAQANNPGVTTAQTNNPGVTTTQSNNPGVTPPQINKPGGTPAQINKPGVTPAQTNKAGVTPAQTNKAGMTPAQTNKASVTSAQANKSGVAQGQPQKSRLEQMHKSAITPKHPQDNRCPENLKMSYPYNPSAAHSNNMLYQPYFDRSHPQASLFTHPKLPPFGMPAIPPVILAHHNPMNAIHSNQPPFWPPYLMNNEYVQNQSLIGSWNNMAASQARQGMSNSNNTNGRTPKI